MNKLKLTLSPTCCGSCHTAATSVVKKTIVHVAVDDWLGTFNFYPIKLCGNITRPTWSVLQTGQS